MQDAAVSQWRAQVDLASATMPLDVLHVTTVHRADDARIYHKECATLHAAGLRVALLAPGDSRPATAMLPEIIGLGALGARGARMLRGPARVVGALRRLRPRLAHIHDPELLVIVPAARALGIRVVYDAHEDYPRHITSKPYIPAPVRNLVASGFGMIERAATAACAHVVAATPDIADRFSAMPRPTVCVRNFASAREFAKAPSRGRERSLVYVGGLRADRGIYDMLSLAERLDMPLHLAGPGWPASLVDELSRTAAWQRHVTYHGVLDRAGVAALLARASIGLVTLHPRPNYLTSLPVKLFEYLASGLPVVASDFPYWRSLTGGHDSVRFVPARDVEAAAAAVSTLLADLARDEAGLRQDATDLFRTSFSWEQEGERLVALYRKLLGNAEVGS